MIKQKIKKIISQTNNFTFKHKYSKKTISPIITITMLLIVTAIAITGFQSWLNSYQSSIFTNIAKDDSHNNLNTKIDTLIGSSLYFKNEFSNLTIIDVKIDGTNCEITPSTYSQGLKEIDIGTCINNTTNSIIEVTILTNKGIFSKIFSKNIYLQNYNNIFSNTSANNTTQTSNKLNYTVALNIANHNAEDGTNNWTNTLGSLSIRTGSPTPYEGTNAFFGGANAQTTAKQRIDISEYFATTLEELNKTMYLNINFMQSSYSTNDAARMGVDFLDENNNSIKGIVYSSSYVAPASIWLNRSLVSIVPSRTHALDLYIDITRHFGTNNDGNIDYITAYIDGTTPSIMNADAEQCTDYWTNTIGSLSIKLGALTPHEESYYFFGGANLQTITKQKIELLNLYDSPDPDIFTNTNVNFTLNWFQASYNSDDMATMGIEYLDIDNNTLSALEYAPLITISPPLTWTTRNLTTEIPPNTYYANIYMQFKRNAGTNNDGYIDEITHQFE